MKVKLTFENSENRTFDDVASVEEIFYSLIDEGVEVEGTNFNVYKIEKHYSRTGSVTPTGTITLTDDNGDVPLLGLMAGIELENLKGAINEITAMPYMENGGIAKEFYVIPIYDETVVTGELVVTYHFSDVYDNDGVIETVAGQTN